VAWSDLRRDDEQASSFRSSIPAGGIRKVALNIPQRLLIAATEPKGKSDCGVRPNPA
jgi:hypothetical protein